MMKYAISIAALASLSLAQTSSDCDPTKKADCPTKPGLNTANYFADFTQGASAASQWTTTSNTINYAADGAQFSIKALGQGPTMQSNFYIFGGYVEVVMKAAPGAGIVSSLVLESDDLDEMDWEMIGSDAAQVQSNYFGKGNTTTYDRGQFHPVANPQTEFVTYALNWTMETTTWLINGAPVRTLNFADAVGGKNYPQTPCNIRLGNWVAGTPGNSPGTIQWAGGLADMSKAPFDMWVKSVKVINYAPAESYKYGDMTGDWQSIQKLGQSAQASAPAAPSGGDSTGPGAVPFESQPAAAAISASSVAAAAGGSPTITITTGAPGAQGVQGAATTSTPCNRTVATLGQAAASGGVTYTISPGGQGQAAAATSGVSYSNGTSSDNSGGGLVAQGVPSGGNSTNPTVTINLGGQGSGSGSGSAATGKAAGQSAGASTLTTATGSAGGVQSFGLGSTGSATAAPAQQSTNAAPAVEAKSVFTFGAALAFLAMLA